MYRIIQKSESNRSKQSLKYPNSKVSLNCGRKREIRATWSSGVPCPSLTCKPRTCLGMDGTLNTSNIVVIMLKF